MSPLEHVRRSIAAALRPDPAIWVDEWAEENRVLPPDVPEPGPYRNARTPYLIDIQRTMSPASPYREGWFMKPHQIGASTAGENFIAASVCAAAGSMLVVFPTLDDAKQWELTRFEPMRLSTPSLRRRIRGADQKGADNTKLRKKYPGGTMRLIGANRVGAMKSATIRYIKFEEPDEYAYAIDEQGSLIDIIRARTTNFGRKAKIFGDGTPTVEGRSVIAQQVARGDQRKWHLHCPDCQHPQVMVWENLRVVDEAGETARYLCNACGALNTEHAWKDKNYAIRPRGMTEAQAKATGRAYWEPTATGEPGVASWLEFEALAAPYGWRPWSTLWQEWKAAQGDEEKLRTFTNNYRGRPWRDTYSSELGAKQLQARAEQYAAMSCPQGGLVCVAGVDTQDNRLAVVIRAFGRGEESWGIYHAEIYGSPSSPETWAKLRDLLEAPIRHASGQTMRVDAAFIDAGGHHGEDVYAFCRDAQLRGRHWCAVRGAKSYDAPKLGRPKNIEFTWRGQPVPGGAELRFVGTQAIKNLIDGRLKIARPGPGYYHYPLNFEVDYYTQLRSERREWRKDSHGHRALWWVKGAERNEAWDCEVYLYAAFLYCMSGRHAEQVWKDRERLYAQRRQLDLLDDGAPVPQPGPDAAQAPAERGSEEQPGTEPAADTDTDTDTDAQPQEAPRITLYPPHAAPMARPAPPVRRGFAGTGFSARRST